MGSRGLSPVVRDLWVSFVSAALILFCVAPVMAADEVLWERNFESDQLGDITSQILFFAAGSRAPEGDNGRASCAWEVVPEPDNPNGKAVQSFGGSTTDHDSWYFADTVSNPATNQGQYTAVQCDLWIPATAQGDGDFRVGLFGLVDLEQNDSYGAWFKWSERKLRVGKLEAGQETNVKSEEFAADADTEAWYTLRCDFKDLGAGQVEVKGTIYPRDNPAAAQSAKNAVAYESKKTFALGIYMYSNTKEGKIWDNFKAVRPAAKQNVVWQQNFESLTLGDYTSQVLFFADGSRNPTGDSGRASSLWEIVPDPLDANGKALQNIAGAVNDHDSWYFVETVNNPAVNRGLYNTLQCDIFIPATAQGDDSHRVGLFGLIDLEQNDSYGAWFKWSERKMRVGKLEAGQETSIKSTEFAAAEDVDQWYTMKLNYKPMGGQIEVKASIWPRQDPSKVVSQSNVVAYESKKTFAIGIYMYSNSKEQKMWDNFVAIEEIRPAANAGVAFRAMAGQKNVMLDGSKSVGGETYKWEVVPRQRIVDPYAASEGSPGAVEVDPDQSKPEIRDADKAIAYFDVPVTIPNAAERLQFKLTINQGTEDESTGTVFVYLQSLGGADTVRGGFAPPPGGWDYWWDGDLSPLNSIQKFRKNFSFDYDLGSHGQSDPVPPAGWAEDWSNSQEEMNTLHTESGQVFFRFGGDVIGTYMDLTEVFSGLGDAGVFDGTGATMLIRAQNFDILRDDEGAFKVYPKPYDSRTPNVTQIPDPNPMGTRVGFGSKTANVEAVLSYGSADEFVYLMKKNGEDELEGGVKIPGVTAQEFSTLWITVKDENGKKTATVYTKPDSAPILTEEVTREARRQDPFADTPVIDPNISNQYFRIDLEALPTDWGANNALCIDFLCLKRGVFAPTAQPVPVAEWMLF